MKNPIGQNIKDFKLLDKIGSGGFAEVFKARCLRLGFENDVVAIKRISKAYIKKRKCEQRIKDEIKIHSKLSHPAIVKFHTSFEDNNYWYLVLELCTGGSLKEFVEQRKQVLSEEEACRLIKEVINGLQYLQLQQVIHRDLSLKNILLTKDGKAKIADFGLSVKCRPNEKQTSNLGTANFMPPEVYMRKPYDFKVDCWAVGCILYALLYGAPPFDDKKRESIKHGVVQSELTFPDYASDEAIKLLKDMLEKDQSCRIEMKDALKYAFFQKYEKISKKYEIISPRSGDSGLNSSSSGSASSSQTVKRTIDRQRRDCVNKVYQENYSYESSNSLGSRRSHSHNGSNLGYQRTKSPCNPNMKLRLESQSEVPIKCRPESPLYPRDLRNLIEENPDCPDINSYNSRYHETDNNKKHESICKERNIITRSNYHNNITNSSAEPLIAIRLEPKRHTTKNAIISILENGEVCVEFLKLKEKKSYVAQVCFVSCDGERIRIFKLKKKILPSEKPPSLCNNTQEVQHYSFENLPEIHKKKYQYAKRFVDVIRAQTPKIILREKEGKCIMMDNDDFQANFCDGYQITEIGGKITVKDQNGSHLTDEKKFDTHVEFLLNTFKEMKERCCKFDKGSTEHLTKLCISLGHNVCFPLIIKWRQNSDDNKENASPRSIHSSSLNGTIAMKSYSGTINTDSSSFRNTSPASMPSPLSNRKGRTTEKNITNIKPALKGQPLLDRGWVVASYNDNIQMQISTIGSAVFFYDMQTHQRLSVDEHPELMKRFQTDAHCILLSVLSGIDEKTT